MIHRWLWPAALCALIVLTAAPAWAQYDPCVRFANCQSCAAQGACGWCAAAGRCMSGNAGGSPYCPGGWSWTSNTCPQVGMPVPAYPQPAPPAPSVPFDQCTRYNNCQSCAAQGACGWCGAQGRCMAGGAGGSPYCQGAWAWTTNACPAVYQQPQPVYPQQPVYGQPQPMQPYDPCARFMACGPCAADAQCGWCSATNRCTRGDADGARFCPGGWAWTDNQCPAAFAPPPPVAQPVPPPQYDACRRYTACGPCAADASCGWCGATNTCLAGQANGSPYCPGAWAWTDNQCTAYQGPAQPVYRPQPVYPTQPVQPGYPPGAYPPGGYPAPPPVYH